MLISEDFIYVHAPKTGGQSVEKVLEPISNNQFDQHSVLFEAFKRNDIDFESRFKFGFVRNPYDREVSNYFWHTKTNDRVDVDNFNDWIKWRFEEGTGILTYDNFRDADTYWYLKGFGKSEQRGFFVNPCGEWLSDFVGRYETINEDWNHICNKMSWDYKLGHHYPSAQRQKDYRIYYNDDSYEIVTKWFKNDLEILGYDFDGIVSDINYDIRVDIHLTSQYNYYYG